MQGVPIRLELRKRDNPYADRKVRRATKLRKRSGFKDNEY